MTKVKKAISIWLTFALMIGIISALTVSAGAVSTTKTLALGASWGNISPSSTVVRGVTQFCLNQGDRLAVNLTFAPVSGTFPNNPGRIDFGMVNVATGVFTFFDHYTSRNGGSINSDMVVPAAPSNGMYVFAVRNMLGAAVKITGTFTFYKYNYPYSAEGYIPSRTTTIQIGRNSTFVSDTDWSSKWLPAINDARLAWNNSGASVSISTTETPGPFSNILTVSWFNENWDGIVYKYPIGQNIVATNSQTCINVRWLEVTPSARNRRVTIVHEFGHLFWLGDEPNTSQRSIMKYVNAGDSSLPYTPSAYDANNVKFAYD